MLLAHIQYKYTQGEAEAGILVTLRSLLSLSILRRATESSLMAPETMKMLVQGNNLDRRLSDENTDTLVGK